MKRLVPFALIGLSACAVTPSNVDVRHVPSNDVYAGDARMHLFLFDPTAPRSFDDRKALARAAIRRDRDCAWVDAPDEVLREATARQGARYVDTLLVVPLRCG